MTEVFQNCTFDTGDIQDSRPTTSKGYIHNLELLAGRLGVQDFDLMLAGDGSGNTCDDPCGHACVAYDQVRQEVMVHKGGFNHGTNNFAELMPYLHALWHYWSSGRFSMKNPIRVLVVSDSELTVNQGKRKYRREANACLWAAMDWFEENGFCFEWRHVRRNSNPIHTTCDKIAGDARKMMIRIDN